MKNEYFRYFDVIFNIDKAYKMIKSMKVIYDIKQIPTYRISRYDSYISTDNINFEIPQGLMINFRGMDLIIDGNHRINRAYQENIKTIKVYYINNQKTIKKFIKHSWRLVK